MGMLFLSRVVPTGMNTVMIPCPRGVMLNPISVMVRSLRNLAGLAVAPEAVTLMVLVG